MKISIKTILFLIILITAVVSIGCRSKDASPPSYTITFSSQFINTESETVMPNPTSIVVEEGDTIGTLPTPPSMSGYRFGGWWTGRNGTGLIITEDTVVNADAIVYAYWVNYVVTYMNEGETHSVRGVVLPARTVASFPTPPTRTGYNFAGWYTAPNGGGTQFSETTEVAADITVYARWTTSNVYVVTYNSKGGTTVGTQYVIAPATTVGALPTPDPTRTFYTFGGWYTCDECGDPANIFTASTPVTENLTIYATWIETPGYTVTYNSYGGTSVDNQYVVPPSTNVGTLPSNPTKRCYAFAGWYTEPNGGGTEFTATTTVDAGSTTEGTITVYANWTWNYPSTSYPLISSPLEIGDYGPSCVGKVFYITNGGTHGLEVAPPNWYEGGKGPLVAWIYGDPKVDSNNVVYQNTQQTLNGNTSTAIGTGLANSNAIVAQVTQTGGTTGQYAAQLSLDYSVGEGSHIFDDWYLPSKDELAELYLQRDVKGSGGFSDDAYWSSSEYGQWDAWSQYFSDGHQTGAYKSDGRLVRPIRAF